MIEQVIQWLKDGDEQEAAAALSECTLDLLFVDLLFEIGGEREFWLYDVNVAAPRKVLDGLEASTQAEKAQIERAIRALAETNSWLIRDIAWVPKPAVQTGLADEEVSAQLSSIDSEHVRRAWEKALKRRSDDPGGAITAARTLLETVCKYILDEAGVNYPGNADLPKLYHLAAKSVKLAPSQHSDQLVRRVLGNCQAVVDGIAALRNEFGDAHGKGADALEPSPLLAELTVNIAGAMATYLTVVAESSRESDSRQLSG